jgi:hypothetical protein|tara:strand:+ start:138 stop:380 length:243 start_codon:yes stop_codon:yes gene_type:complete
MNERKAPLDIETYRTCLLSRVKESQIGQISRNADGNQTFDVNPIVADYFWVLDLAEREGIKATPHTHHTTITITEEKTNV